MSALRFEKVTVSTGERTLLRSLSFDVNAGEIVALVGSNGAGKTTALRAIIGAEKLSGGSIHLDGRPLTEISVRQRAVEVGYVPQRVAFVYPYSVREFLAMSFYPCGGVSGDDSCKSRIDEVLVRVNCLHLRERSLLTLSGGELQRVLLAAALVHRPRLLLLDEPTASLDPVQESAMANLLPEIRRESKATLLLVTHNLELVRRIADRVIAIKDGALFYSGDLTSFMNRSTIATLYGALAGEDAILPGLPSV